MDSRMLPSRCCVLCNVSSILVAVEMTLNKFHKLKIKRLLDCIGVQNMLSLP